MKKTIILALIVALVAAVPVAAAGVDFGGSIETEIAVNKKKGEDVQVVPGSELSLNLGVNAAQDKVRAGLEFGLSEEEDGLVPSGISLGDIELKQAFIEADGAFWHGGPEATTRFGTLGIDYSPYASLTGRSGISISGVDLDVIELNGFYALAAEGESDVLGMRSSLNLVDEVDLGIAVLSDSDIIRIQADAAAEPIEGLRIAASAAADRTEESGLQMDNLVKVAADYALDENTNITVGFKHISDDWAVTNDDGKPKYIAEKTEDGDGEHDWIHLERAKNRGVFVGLETAQQGMILAAAYDQMFAEASIAADTEYEGFRFDVKTVLDVPAMSAMAAKSTTFGVSREFDVMEGLAVDARNEGKWTGGEEKGLVHTIGAKSTLGILPAVDGLELSAEVSAAELKLDAVDHNVAAMFAAPNGLYLGIEHARYDCTTFNAGMKVEF